MSDWPGPGADTAESGGGPRKIFMTGGAGSGPGQQLFGLSPLISNAVWVTANSSRYVPIYVQQSVTVFQMGTIVGTQSGNCDVGIYDEFGTRLVSSGTTAVGAAGYQIFNIADTALQPGTYYLAMGCDNVTAAFNRVNWVSLTNGAVNGCLTQTVYPLPATWTTPTSAVHSPHIIAHTVAVA